jgi:YHYH protein/Secretion system C-terminal sorting domain
MKKSLFILLFCPLIMNGQAIVNKWTMNKDGKKASYWETTGSGMNVSYTFRNMTDSADILKVCYTADSVWVRSQGLTDYMGKYLNPGTCVAQNYVHRFPRNPSVPTTKTVSSKGGAIGLLTNGIPIFGLGNASSWNGSANVMGQGGSGIWNMEVGKAEGFVLDTAFGAHPQQQGAYHTHTTPYRLYKNSSSSVHSPLIGFAFDGNPIYGPYGYSTATNSASAVTRMKTGYSLRNITTRTTLPYGIAASQTGPPVNATYPIGTYCEDYEWLASNSGDLDKYNGRTCVTPEYPSGTYAYFVTVDAAGASAFPHIVGIEYYGAPVTANFPTGPTGNGLSIPNSATTCLTPTRTGIFDQNTEGSLSFTIYPNPSNGQVSVLFKDVEFTDVQVVNAVGQIIYRNNALENSQVLNMDLNTQTGIYFVKCFNRNTGVSGVQKLVVN